MARVTRHVGFCLIYASTFMHPFYAARLLNSLDRVTNGCIALNVITSTRRGEELLEAVRFDESPSAAHAEECAACTGFLPSNRARRKQLS